MNFKIETFHNPYLSPGASRVDAILTVTSESSFANDASASGSNLVVGIILDSSGSMEGERIQAVKLATRKAINLLGPETSFFVVKFSDEPELVYGLSKAMVENKRAAEGRVNRIEASSTTKMSKGLTLARQEFLKEPKAIHYALFLTDGKNDRDDENELDRALKLSEGVFQCDCRGVGTDWQPKQLQRIAQRLLGTAMIIPEPEGIEPDFTAAINGAIGRGIKDVRLRLWTPKSSRVIACKQVSPEIIALTDRSVQAEPQSRDYPCGAWGQETRDYYVAFEISPGETGEEMLACRPSLVYHEPGQALDTKISGPPILATWTDNDALSTRINEHVAHYTGQEELAEAIRSGLEARGRGDVDTATKHLGRAAQLAQQSGNDETTRRLAKVVEIVNAEEGTVKLKSKVAKADEMDLDLASTRTARAGRRIDPVV